MTPSTIINRTRERQRAARVRRWKMEIAREDRELREEMNKPSIIGPFMVFGVVAFIAIQIWRCVV